MALRDTGVYCLLFPNGKKYIGYTIKQGFEIRFNDHYKDAYTRKKQQNYLKSKAIRKYGWNNIEKKVLIISDDQDYCKLMEKQLIAAWKTNNIDYGYNSTSGGDGCNNHKHSEETKMKMRESKLKNPNLYWLGKKRNQNDVEKIADSKRKIYILNHNNEEIFIDNMTKFCENNNINKKALLSNKKYKNYILQHKYNKVQTISIKEIYFE